MTMYELAEARFTITSNHNDAELNRELSHAKWCREGNRYVKDDGLNRWTLTKQEDEYRLRFEQLDLFGKDTGPWDPTIHPEREALLQATLDEIRRCTDGKVTVHTIRREAR